MKSKSGTIHPKAPEKRSPAIIAEQSLETRMCLAKSLIDDKDADKLNKALAIFEEISRADPDNIAAHLLYLECYAKLNVLDSLSVYKEFADSYQDASITAAYQDFLGKIKPNTILAEKKQFDRPITKNIDHKKQEQLKDGNEFFSADTLKIVQGVLTTEKKLIEPMPAIQPETASQPFKKQGDEFFSADTLKIVQRILTSEEKIRVSTPIMQPKTVPQQKQDKDNEYFSADTLDILTNVLGLMKKPKTPAVEKLVQSTIIHQKRNT